MTESDVATLTDCLYFVIFELAVIIGLWIAKALNWWKW